MKRGFMLVLAMSFLLFVSVLSITAQTSQVDEDEEGFLYNLLNPFKIFFQLLIYPFDEYLEETDTIDTTMSEECTYGVMCDDYDECTIDSCEHGGCTYELDADNPDCIELPEETDPCLIDPASCEDPEDIDTGVQDPGEIGCLSDPMMCDDEDTCTQDECDSSGSCINLPIPNCVDPITGCSEASHCDDADPCTRDSCNNGVCSHDSLGDKCDPDAEDEEDPEETDPCVLDPASCKNPGDGDKDEDYCTANPTSPNCIDEYCKKNPNNPKCDPNYQSEGEDESGDKVDAPGVEESSPETEDESNIFENIWNFFKGLFG